MPTSTIASAISADELVERLQAFVGQGGESATPARDRITLEGVRQMVDITGDRNPIYSDPDFAARSVHGGLVAPPMSVLSWSVRNFCPVETSDWVGEDGIRRYRLDPNPARQQQGTDADQRPYGVFSDVLELLDKAGYNSVAVTDGEYSFSRYPRVGDQLSFGEAQIQSIVGPKVTSLGEGFFITQVQRVVDEHGEEVGLMRHSSINFKPQA